MRISVSVINDLVTDQRVHKVCTTLTEAGHEVSLIGRGFRDSKPLQRKYKTYRMRLLFKRSFVFYAEYNIRLFLHLLFTKTDLLLSNDTDTLVANFLVSKLRNKPLVFDAHEMFPEVPEVVNRKRVKAVWTKIEDWIFPKLKYAYTVCQSIAEEYNKKYGIAMKVVRNIPFASQVAPPHKPIESDGRKIILYQGAVNIGRGIEWVMDAMPYLDDFVFYIVGDGDILSELKQKAKEQCMEDRVVFTGRVPFEDLPAYTACADIGVNLLENRGLNYYYSLPNRIFDFIRNNIPILANNFPEIKRIVEQYDLGILVDETTPEYLAEKIKELHIKGKNAKGFALANKELCWENEAETILRMIAQIEQKDN